MAAALSGCVIVSENKREVKYQAKCDSCGWVESSIRSCLLMPGLIHNSGFYCFKCKKAIRIRIRG